MIDQHHQGSRVTSPLRTVMIVDDDVRLCQTLTQMIRVSSPEMQVSCAHNGKKGLSMITRDEPDLVILDVDMPGMNGLSVLRKLKNSSHALRTGVIILTGNPDAQYAADAMYWYADSYLTKPCTREKLMTTIHRSLASRAAPRPESADADARIGMDPQRDSGRERPTWSKSKAQL